MIPINGGGGSPVDEQPYGTVLSAVGIGASQQSTGAVVQMGKSIFAQSGALASDIPNFDTRTPEWLKGFTANDAYFGTLPAVSQSVHTCSSDLSTNGTQVALVNISGSDVEIWRRVNGGGWSYIQDIVASTALDDSRGFCFTDNNGVWLLGSGTKNYRSTDDGLTWGLLPTADLNQSPVDVTINRDTNTLIMISVSSAADAINTVDIWRSKNMGLSWLRVDSTSNRAAVCWEGGNNWRHFGAGTSATRVSTDDGLTWANDVTPSVALSTAVGALVVVKSTSYWYILTDGSVYATTDLTSMGSILLSNIASIGCDNADNAIAITRNSTRVNKIVANVATPLDQTANTSYNMTNKINFNNGTFIDCYGSTASAADALAGNAWDARQFRFISGGYRVGRSLNGTSILALGLGCLIRSTDDFETYSFISTGVDPTLVGAQNSTIIGGSANGDWIICFPNDQDYLRSSDDGLTWVLDNDAINAQGVVGGANSDLLMTDQNGDGYYSADGGLNWSLKAGAGVTEGCTNPVYWDDTFYWISVNGATDYLSSYQVTPNITNSFVLQTVFSAAGNSPFVAYEGVAFVDTTIIYLSPNDAIEFDNNVAPRIIDQNGLDSYSVIPAGQHTRVGDVIIKVGSAGTNLAYSYGVGSDFNLLDNYEVSDLIKVSDII